MTYRNHVPSTRAAPVASGGGFGFGPSTPTASTSTGFGSSGSGFAQSSALSNPFGRVESTRDCFARNGDAQPAANWPQSQASSVFRPSANSFQQHTPLFGSSGQQPQQSIFGGGSSNAAGLGGRAPIVSGGGFRFGSGTTAPGTVVGSASTGFGGLGTGVGFGSTSAGFTTKSTGLGTNASGFGETSTLFGSRSSVAASSSGVPASSENPFARRTAKPLTGTKANPFATSAANPFGTSTTQPLPTNPFATKPPTSSTVNPFAVPETAVHSFGVSNPFGKPASAQRYDIGYFGLDHSRGSHTGAAAGTMANLSATKLYPGSSSCGFASPARALDGYGVQPSSTAIKSSRPWTGISSDKFKSGTGQQPTPVIRTHPTPFTGFSWTNWKKNEDPGLPRASSTSAPLSGSSNSFTPATGFRFSSLGTFPSATTSFTPATSSSLGFIAPMTADASVSTVTPLPNAASASDASSHGPLVASPDVDPYGSGSCGAGVVEQKVKAALSNSPSSSAAILFEPSTARKATPAPARQQPSARFAARLGLASRPLQLVPVKQIQPHFPWRRSLATAAPDRTEAKQHAVDPFRFSSSFSRLAVSKRSLRIRVEPNAVSPTSSKTESKRKTDAETVAQTKVEVVVESATKCDATASLPIIPESKDENKDAKANAEEAAPSQSCPTLLNDEYFTVPSIRELELLSEQELASVEGFVIGRRGCGEIAFVGATDVRGLKLDDLVAFSPGEIVVYPNDDAKPVVGCALNKSAVVQLRGLSFEQHETREHFLARLEKHTKALGAEFLGYDNGDHDENVGVWKFRVEHF
ncbi:hypothetical protein BBJ28_00021164 [Nothophytophthora sp. Chile5]|nr:hypothetical protein BBJ28_00021164 [Nothophytophthora sp. Chile5]